MKFLIIKTSSLGDIIQAFPTLFFLRERFPQAQIDWVVEERFAELVKAVSMIDNVICFDSHRWRKNLSNTSSWSQISKFFKRLREVHYDVAFDLQGNCKSGLVLWKTRAKNKVGFGRKTVHELPNIIFANKRYDYPQGYNIREDNLCLARSFFGDDAPVKEVDLKLQVDPQSLAKIDALLEAPELQTRPRVMICAGSAWPNKQLLPETLRDLMKLIHQSLNASFLLIWGSQAEKEAALELHSVFPSTSVVVDRMPLPALQELMRRVEVVISMDSLPLHLAGLTSTPVFSVFGASSSSKYAPTGLHQLAYQGSCPYGRTFEKRCPILRTCETGACIRSLEAKELFRHFSRWWASVM